VSEVGPFLNEPECAEFQAACEHHAVRRYRGAAARMVNGKCATG
jgi:hypothetical protein